MAKINPRRMTHRYNGELVVFLIGMRVNQFWRVDRWLPTFLAMFPMLTELSKDHDSGLLGFEITFGANGPTIIQYWNSHERLYAYASAQDAAHRPAWSAFNRRARNAAGVVGIWHETYQVARAESIHVGMPTVGLLKATEAVVIGPRHDRAADRLAAGSAAA